MQMDVYYNSNIIRIAHVQLCEMILLFWKFEPETYTQCNSHTQKFEDSLQTLVDVLRIGDRMETCDDVREEVKVMYPSA